MAVTELAFSVITKIVTSIISSGTNYHLQEFIRRKKIEGAVENSCLAVVETLADFFASERISEDDQFLIINECDHKLTIASKDYLQFFKAGLDPQKLYEHIHSRAPIDQEIRARHLEGFYEMVFVRMSSLLCTVPPTMKDWELNAWSENYRRLDSIAVDLKAVFDRVNAIDGKVSRSGALTMAGIRKYLTQRVAVKLDITGLRADQVLTGSLEDFFVHPAISEIVREDADQERLPRLIGDADGSASNLSSGRNILFGVAGSGKTTWSSWFERSILSDQAASLPVRVVLRSINYEEAPSLFEITKLSMGANLADRLDIDFVQALADEGKITLILDGFDEIGNQTRDSAIAWILDISKYAPNVSIVVTSRPLTTEHLSNLGDEWSFWQIQPFDTDRIRKYIQKWHANAPVTVDSESVDDIVSLANRWSRDPTIEPLTGNPLLLTTLLTVHHLDGSLPTGRAELYERYVKGMLGVWDDRRKVNPNELPLTLDQRRTVLTDIAVAMLLEGHDEFTEENALRVVSGTILEMGESCSASDVLDALRERSGLIVGPGTYNFSHKSIGEYLVAQAILNGAKVLESGSRLDRFTLFEHRGKDRWNTILFLWAGLAPLADVESFLNQCFDVGDFQVALGVFNDQFRRFPRRIRSALGGRSIEAIGRMHYDHQRMRLVVGAHNTGWKKGEIDYCTNVHLEIPYADIRSVQDQAADVSSLLFELIDDGLITTHQIKGASRTARQLVWIRLVTRVKDAKSLRDISKTIPFRATKKRWLFWLLEFSFSQHLLARTNDLIGLDARLRVFQDTDPDVSRVLLLAALSSLVTRLPFDTADVNEENREHVRTMIERSASAIISQPVAMTDRDLLGTQDWSMIYSRNRSLEGNDLLRAVEQMIGESFDLGGELPHAVDGLRALISDLIDRRTALASTT